MPAASAQGLTDMVIDEIRYIEPRLPSDAIEYKPDTPEILLPEQLYAKSAILMEARSGRVLFEKNAEQIMYPASTTKILTVLVALLKTDDMSQIVTLSETAGDIPDDSSTIPLKVGETISFLDLLYATMVRSGNEGANLIAETISGSIPAFVDEMNQAAAMIGCTKTHFTNPSGLHHSEQYTTALDMAKIARAAMQIEKFRPIAAAYSYRLPRSNLRGARVLPNNAASALLNPNHQVENPPNTHYYEYAIGIKTGFHSHAGYCYVGYAKKDGVELVSVVFYTSNSGRWVDTKRLMEYGFTQVVSMTPLQMYYQNPLTVETSGFSMADPDLGRLQLDLMPKGDPREVFISATRAEMEAISRDMKRVAIIDYTHDFAAPIEAGDTMGTFTYYPPDGGSEVAYDLVASRSIERRLNAPRSIAEIEMAVYSDPNPFPPFSLEFLFLVLAPFGAAFLVIYLLMRLFRRTGRHRKGRVPKPGNRYFR